jgi:hypothetical protein
VCTLITPLGILHLFPLLSLSIAGLQEELLRGLMLMERSSI